MAAPEAACKVTAGDELAWGSGVSADASTPALVFKKNVIANNPIMADRDLNNSMLLSPFVSQSVYCPHRSDLPCWKGFHIVSKS
jgi:hypothetical protein